MISIPLFIVVSLVVLAAGVAAGYYVFRSNYFDKEGQLVEQALAHRPLPATHRAPIPGLEASPLQALSSSMENVRLALAERTTQEPDPEFEHDLDQRLDQLGSAIATLGETGFDPVALREERHRLRKALEEAEAGRLAAEQALASRPDGEAPPTSDEALQNLYDAVVRDRDALQEAVETHRIALEQKDAEIQQMHSAVHAAAPPDVQEALARLTEERDAAKAEADAAVARFEQQLDTERAAFALRETEWAAQLTAPTGSGEQALAEQVAFLTDERNALAQRFGELAAQHETILAERDALREGVPAEEAR
ncbi:MAG: hypothetical protein IAE99_11595, partial [Rhodothermales bacterium]|nr:hypothetical protein [Rhodothermales bacterium]